MNDSYKLVFPKITQVQLKRFSLYTLKPDIRLSLPRGVFCLAGANGLGKSTFLATLNFALTGMVPDPERQFMSVEEYYKYGIGFSRRFFDGRIAEEDRDAAEISIQLEVGNTVYELTRGMFEPEELRFLQILDKSSSEVVFDGADVISRTRNQEYQKRLIADVGLASFAQFVFLQHFVFTFDESRHLVLWDQRVLNQALYLCFGADYNKALEADQLRREVERFDSLGRNASFRASNVRGRMELLRESVRESAAMRGKPEPQPNLFELKLQHKERQEEVLRLQAEIEYKTKQLDDLELRFMEISAEISSLDGEYAREFSLRVTRSSHVELHPIITASITEGRCVICGTESEEVSVEIQRNLDSHRCPLCNSMIEVREDDSASLVTLEQIDTRITEAKQQLELTRTGKERISTELEALEIALNSAALKLKQLEATNERELLLPQSSDSGVELTLAKFQDELSEQLRQKKDYYKKRDDKREELLKYQRELEQQYLTAEAEFVPLFQSLAELFLGIDLTIRLESSRSLTSLGLSLALELRGAPRRENYQLSESQRFFLDIALRMALAQYTSEAKGAICLFVDTPEGSLDIAYESRAGQMFARFARSGHDVVMTANINSSQLLRRLAQDCGRQTMVLQRMMSWTELSDVQMEEEGLFERAYDEIEAALDFSKSTAS